MRFLDPACGCGNFLVIAYREIRKLELEALEARWPKARTDMGEDARQGILDPSLLSRVTVDQFYGIEYEEFPAMIAEVAMWMADHIANNAFNQSFSVNIARIPLTGGATIRHGDALEVDWSEVLPAEKCSFVMGNPPFVGAKYQTAEQRAQVRRLAALGGSGGTLDYVAAWFLKAGAYLQANTRIRIAFVATNSITQGEQVAQLWPLLFDRYGLEIAFAHRTFSWGSEARGKAHVHVVIVGLTHRDFEPKEKRLFSYPDIKGDPVESRHGALTAYLFDAKGAADRHLVVKEESRPINGTVKMTSGVQMIDNGILTFTHDEAAAFLEAEPKARRFFRDFLGGQEFINGFTRKTLYLADADPSALKKLPMVTERMNLLRKYRASSSRPSTQAMASYPTKLGVDNRLGSDYLVIPNTSSERRDYVPIGWLGPEVIASQKLRIVADASGWEFGILTSGMHMAWLSHIGGRLKSDYSYTHGLVYNTFPWPEASGKQRAKVGELAQAVLDARAAHPTSSLADLYDPDTMPANLRKAHVALDRAVDRLYRRAPFDSDRDRVEHLFGLYEKLVNPLSDAEKRNRRTARRVARKSAGG
nr:DNA methyltransferase [Qipengyuania huizhouensis]